MNLEKFQSLDPQDVHLYYMDTHIRVKCPRNKMVDWEWALVRCVNPNLSMDVYTASGNLFPIQLGYKEDEMDFNLPESGIYPYKGSIIYTQKIPRRQNKKAVCNETYNFSNFKTVFPHHLASSFPANGFSVRSSMLNRLLEEEKYTDGLLDAWKNIKKKKSICEALDLNFSLSLGIYDNFPVLWYRFIPIAKMVTSTLLQVHNKLFVQEVIDRFSLKEGIQIQSMDLSK